MFVLQSTILFVSKQKRRRKKNDRDKHEEVYLNCILIEGYRKYCIAVQRTEIVKMYDN